jgi:hypothetical protein
LPFGHSPWEGEKILDVSEFLLIAGIFSPPRGDAAERQRGVAIRVKSSKGDTPHGSQIRASDAPKSPEGDFLIPILE